MARKPTAKQQAKIDDQRVERVYYQRCSGIQISILDIPKVFKAGLAAIAAGADDAALSDAVFNFVQTIRKN